MVKIFWTGKGLSVVSHHGRARVSADMQRWRRTNEQGQGKNGRARTMAVCTEPNLTRCHVELPYLVSELWRQFLKVLEAGHGG